MGKAIAVAWVDRNTIAEEICLQWLISRLLIEKAIAF
jgi:hypothetical protein